MCFQGFGLVRVFLSLMHEVNVQGVHELRGRRMGSTIHLDVHIEVLSVSYSLDIV
jgi:divalent metal cation (Fe/Co/Zn/Cd) transporter